MCIFNLYLCDLIICFGLVATKEGKVHCFLCWVAHSVLGYTAAVTLSLNSGLSLSDVDECVGDSESLLQLSLKAPWPQTSHKQIRCGSFDTTVSGKETGTLHAVEKPLLRWDSEERWLFEIDVYLYFSSNLCGAHCSKNYSETLFVEGNKLQEWIFVFSSEH